MEDFKIAVIGGPKGGKSDFIKVIRRNLNRGKENGEFKCIIIPETAREFITNVAKFDETTRRFFQTCIFNRQLFKEREAKEVSKNLEDNKSRVVTICDRGIMDNKAYLDDDEYFKYMAKNAGVSEIELLDDYNLVLYFVSSAKMDDEIYEQGQDDIRRENKESASNLDDKTLKAWLGHRNIVIIQPEEDFNVKLSKAVLTVKNQLKFGRIDYPRYDISDYDTSLYEISDFPTISEVIYRFPKLLMADYLEGVIQRTYDGNSSYIKFTKCDKGGKYGYVTESEEPINKKEFKKLLKERGCYPRPISQEVTYVYEDNTLYRIIKEEDKKYYEIMSGEIKPPRLLLSNKIDIPKQMTKSFKNS